MTKQTVNWLGQIALKVLAYLDTCGMDSGEIQNAQKVTIQRRNLSP